MQDTLVIDTPEQLKALSDSRRLELLKQLVESAQTVAQLAEALGEEKSKLYYHLSELETHRFIEVVETRQKGNLIEKIYRATARLYTVDRALFRNEHGLEMLAVSIHSVLDGAAADLHKLATSGMSPEEAEDKLLYFHRLVHIPDARRDEFNRRIRALIADFSRSDEPGSQDQYSWTLLLCPRHEPGGEGEPEGCD